MSSDYMQKMMANPAELEKYIKQIQSYEAQMEKIELAASEEEGLKKKRPDWTLVLWSGIAGLCFRLNEDTREGLELKSRLVPGLELKLVRDADNKYDRWAVAIHTMQDEMLGYITRYKNETIARLMDKGYVFHAFVEDEMQTNYEVPDQQVTRTEDYRVPYSVWME